MPASPSNDAHWVRLVRFAENEVERLLDGLDPALAEPARQVPVTCQAVPDDALVRDGLDPDLLGLFVGVAYHEAESGVHDLPAQILLFLENLWSYAEGDVRTYRDEVARTYLHELGHYLGLDEDALRDRDLD
jgi:predicted Zn-dependent protease with MMP-like domain